MFRCNRLNSRRGSTRSATAQDVSEGPFPRIGSQFEGYAAHLSSSLLPLRSMESSPWACYLFLEDQMARPNCLHVTEAHQAYHVALFIDPATQIKPCLPRFCIPRKTRPLRPRGLELTLPSRATRDIWPGSRNLRQSMLVSPCRPLRP